MVRKSLIVTGLVLLLLGVALAAGAQGKLGLVFNIWDGDTSSSDGLSAGAGAKYWFTEKTALRGLLDFEYVRNSNTDTSSTYIGLGAAFEYHFKPGRVSPYAGALAGVGIVTDPSDVAFTLGGLLGAEVRIMEAVSLFAEYSLRMSIIDPFFTFTLGAGNNAAIGVVVYLP